MSRIQTSQANTGNTKPRWNLFSTILSIVLMIVIVTGIIIMRSDRKKIRDKNLQIEQAQTTLNTLEGSLDTQLLQNKALTVSIEDGLMEIEIMEQNIKRLQVALQESNTKGEQIEARLKQLEDLKVLLEKDLSRLKVEKADLIATSEELQEALTLSEEEIFSLNQQVLELTESNHQLLERLYTLAPAGYSADNFNIITRNRRDKLTVKARRIDEINVAFDLNNVPESFFGDHEIYLILTMIDGNPVPGLPAEQVSIRPPGNNEPFSMQVTKVKKITLKERQTISMSIEPDVKLERGLYHVLIFSDNGFLGSTGCTLK